MASFEIYVPTWDNMSHPQDAGWGHCTISKEEAEEELRFEIENCPHDMGVREGYIDVYVVDENDFNRWYASLCNLDEDVEVHDAKYLVYGFELQDYLEYTKQWYHLPSYRIEEE